MKSATTIIDEVAKKWGTLTDAQRQNTSIGVAGIYQLSRWNALMLNYDMALQATETSMNSYNSAAREQEKYNQSLEARINRMQTAWYGFADALGNTVIYDTLVAGTSALEGMTKLAGTAGGSMLTLAGTLGILGGGLSLVSSRFTGMTGSVIQSIAADKAKSVSTTTLTGKMYTLAAGTTAASTAFRGLLIATGVGAVLAGLGVALGFLINKYSEAKQEAEEFDAYLNKNTTALTDNKAEVDKLITSLETLRQQREDGVWNSEKEEEYLSVQNRLAELFPSIIDYVDANGNSHIMASDAIAKEIDMTNELINAERELNREQANDTFKKNSKELDSLAKKIENTRNLLGTLNEHQSDDTEAIAKVKLDLLKLEKQYSDSSKEIQKNIMDIANSWFEAGENVDSVILDKIQSSINNLDFSNLSSEKLAMFSRELSEIMNDMNNAFSKDDASGFKKATSELGELYKSYDLIEGKVKKIIPSFEELKGSADVSNALSSSADAMDEFGDSVDNTVVDISEMIAEFSELKDISEQLTGISKKQIDGTYDLVTVYELLSNKTNLTTQQQFLLADAKEKLNSLYPHLIKNGELQVNAVMNEMKAYETLQESVKNARDGKLTAEQQMTLSTTLGVNERIKAIKQEMLAMEAAYNTYNRQSNELMEKYNRGEKLTDSQMRGLMYMSNTIVKYESNASELDKLMVNVNDSIGKLSSANKSISESSSNSSKSQKDANKSSTQSIYITDQYKQAMEALNTALDKQNALRDDYSTHSEKYRKALRAEISLLQQQLNLQQSQAQALRNQISSGKIKQTGSVSVPTGTSSSGSVSVSGWGGNLTSKQGNRIHPITGKYQYHAGIDLAGKTGTRLDSLVNGKVIGQSYNSISGNYVQIQDEQGNKHFFAHLDKAIAKLGDTIVKGQQIGTIGSTGGSTGSHLHYEVKDKNGNYLDAATFAKEARTGKVTTTSTSTVQSTSSGIVETGLQAIDEAKSTLAGLESDVIATQEKIAQLEREIIDSQFEYFNFKREQVDRDLERQNARLSETDRRNNLYNRILDYQLVLMGRKKDAYIEELQFAKDLIASGTLTEAVLDSTNEKIVELETSLKNLNMEMQQFKLDKLTNEYENTIALSNELMEIEKAKLDLFNTISPHYTETQQTINRGYREQKEATEQLIYSLRRLIDEEGLTGDSLREATAQLNKAKSELISLERQISQGNYDLIINIKTKYDESKDDLQYELDIEREIRDRYEEGSIAYQESIQREIELLQKQADERLELYKLKENELKQAELTAEDYKALTEHLEDLSLEYESLINAIRDTEKAMEESKSKQLEEIADSMIDAYKDYLKERQDETSKAYDEELKVAQEHHEKIKKQLSDEMELYRKNAQEKLDLIDRQESQRTYDMEMEDLLKQRSDLDKEIAKFSMDNSNEGKKKRKELLKQSDELDKSIAEKRHDRDIELQKQTINALLEDKEDEIAEKERLEDERYEYVVETIEAEKEYWNQHYEDLLNNQRKFEEMKRKIISGKLAEVKAEFEGYAIELESTMYKLENTLDGTMQAVGTTIRQNVIDNLREAINMVNEFNKLQDSSLDSNKPIIVDRNPNAGKDGYLQDLEDKYSGNGGSKLSQGDYKVLLAKYLNENSTKIAKDDSTVWHLLDKANKLAAEGRAEGSTITADKDNLNSVIERMSESELKGLRDYVKDNVGNTIYSDYLLADIKDWINDLETPREKYGEGDFKVILAKYFREYSTLIARDEDTKWHLDDKGNKLASEGRGQGSIVSANDTLNTVLADMSMQEIQKLKDYVKANVKNIIFSDYLQDDILRWTASLDTGGFVKSSGGGNDGKGGKLAMLHPNEVVLNAVDTKSLIKNIQVSDSLAKTLHSMQSSMNNIFRNMTPSFATSGGGDINIQFGDVHNTTQQEADNFARNIVSKVRSLGGKI